MASKDNEAARRVFDEMIAQTTDPDVRATRELLREYFCNPQFRGKFATFAAKFTGRDD